MAAEASGGEDGLNVLIEIYGLAGAGSGGVATSKESEAGRENREMYHPTEVVTNTPNSSQVQKNDQRLRTPRSDSPSKNGLCVFRREADSWQGANSSSEQKFLIP
jgi:hypothetical protein